VTADLRRIEHALALPAYTIKAVERRANRDYAIVLDGRRLNAAVRRGQLDWRRTSRRVLRLSARTVHGKSKRWRGRNWRLRRWLERELGLPCRASNRELDLLRAAIIRASQIGEIQRLAREHGRAA
jgi:hypothetical protein